MSGMGFLGGLGKRLLQAVEQRVAPAEVQPVPKRLPPGIAPDRLDEALARLRAERPPADLQSLPGDAPRAQDMSD